nr:hypothetical protein [Tanacetum cinerariifolium]
MSTQQDIYTAGSESRPPMLNKENYVSWSSRLLWYAKSRPNGKLIHNSILNGPYVRRMIPEPGDVNREVTVTETFHLQTDDELSNKELKQIEANDQAIQTILLGLPEDIYAAVDSCETAQEIWLRVQQMMKGSDIGIQEKKAKLFNEWEWFTSNEGESIESYYHRYLKFMNDFKRNKHFSEKIATDLDEIEEVNVNCILMANLQQASTLGTQIDSAPVYDSNGSAEVHENCDDNEILNMFTQEEQYTELLEPIPESHQVPQNDNNVSSEDSSVEQAIEVEKVSSVNCKLKETNADLTTELARFKNQIRCFEISQEKYDKLERCYQQFVYQEQCLSKKINALHLSTGKQIMTLNEQISELNKQLLKEKSTVSFLLEEKKKLKSDFKTYEDELLDKQIQLQKKIKELNNILLKAGQSIQTIHMLSPKPDSFYHTEQKMALGYQNPFYLKQAQKKQQCLYDGKVLLEKHDPLVVHDSEEILQLAQESREKMKLLNKEIKPANYTKINHLSGCDECKYDKISYDKAYKDMQQKIERLQAQLGDLKGKSKDTSCVSDTQNPLSHKLENENVELELQVLNYARENAHLKATYKNLFDFISVLRTQTKTIIASLQNELQRTIYKNAKLRTHLFKKVSDQKDNTCDTSKKTKFAKQPIMENLPKVVTSNSISTPQESKVVNNDKVIAPGMFRINPFKTYRDEKHVPNTVSATARTKPITVSQPPVFTKKDVNSDSNGSSSIGVDNTAKTRRI